MTDALRLHALTLACREYVAAWRYRQHLDSAYDVPRAMCERSQDALRTANRRVATFGAPGHETVTAAHGDTVYAVEVSRTGVHSVEAVGEVERCECCDKPLDLRADEIRALDALSR